MSDKKKKRDTFIMQGQNGDFRGGNGEVVTEVVKEKPKIRAVLIRAVKHVIYGVCKECFDSSVVSSPLFLRCEDVASKLPRGPSRSP